MLARFVNSLPTGLSQRITKLYFQVLVRNQREMHSCMEHHQYNNMDVKILPALKDNYMYLLVDRATNEAAVVDPVETKTVLQAGSVASTSHTPPLAERSTSQRCNSDVPSAADTLADALNAVINRVKPHNYYVSNFDPAVHNFETWCNEVERAKLTNNWGDSECLSRVAHCLKGDARTWLNEWVTSDRSWSNFIKEFRSLCPHKLDYANILFEVMNTNSNKFNTYAEYARRSLLRLRIVKGLSEELMVQIVIRGINDAQVRAAAANADLTIDNLVTFLAIYTKPSFNKPDNRASSKSNLFNKRNNAPPGSSCYLCDAEDGNDDDEFAGPSSEPVPPSPAADDTEDVTQDPADDVPEDGARDHAGGNEELAKQVPGIEVYGGDDRIGALTRKVEHNTIFNIGNLMVQCLFTPCHTMGHVCYYVTTPDEGSDGVVFTGDTLFLAGCGRFFEGNAEQMYNAFAILGSLPDNTKVYCGHEYTLQNLRFAAHVEPSNQEILKKIAWSELRREEGKPTVPSTIGEEKTYNPFMRVYEAEIMQHAGAQNAIQAMKNIRLEKDSFQ
ncbi:hypothetical protein SFRURICE_010475 [Spodoptera frugiperda]|nr:hypothetical protein SFRURICE_010475 [Spodoptera frugiperda]